MNLLNPQEPWSPWENPQLIVELVCYMVVVELGETRVFMKNSCLLPAAHACVISIRSKLRYSSNLIAPDKRNGNKLNILTLLVELSTFHHRMPKNRLRTSKWERRQLQKKRWPNVDFSVEFLGLRDPSIIYNFISFFLPNMFKRIFNQ